MSLAQRLLADRHGLLEQGPGGGVVPLLIEQRRQVVQADGVVGVALAQHLLADRQRPLVEGPGGGEVRPRIEHSPQVVQAGGIIAVALSQNVLSDCQLALEQLGRLGVLARLIQRHGLSVQLLRFGQLLPLLAAHHGQALGVLKRQPGVGHPPEGLAMVLPQDFQGLEPGGPGCHEVLALEIQARHVAQRGGEVRVVRGQAPPLDRQHRLGRGDGLGELAGGMKPLGLIPEAEDLLHRRLLLRRHFLGDGRGHRHREGERCDQDDDPDHDAANVQTWGHTNAPGLIRSRAGVGGRPHSLLPKLTRLESSQNA